MTLEKLAGSTSQSSEGIQDYNSNLTDGVGGTRNRVGRRSSSSFSRETRQTLKSKWLAFEVEPNTQFGLNIKLYAN